MKWIIQKNLIAESQLEEILAAVQDNRINYELVDVIPFSDTVEVRSQHLWNVPYGSTRLVTFAYENKWPGMFFNENFKTSVWRENRPDMLNADSDILSVEDALLTYCDKSSDDMIFVRPDNDLKEFAGEVMSVSDFSTWVGQMSDGSNGNLLHEDTQIVVAPARNILAEWRWFVVGGKVVDGSMYRHRGQLVKDHETWKGVYEEAQEQADIWLPHECCVMDTALVGTDVESAEHKVIEFNNINSSGFYNHDVEKIVLAITEFVKEKENGKEANEGDGCCKDCGYYHPQLCSEKR